MMCANVASNGGGVSDKNLDFSTGFMTKEKRNIADIEMTVKRLKEMKLKGYVKLFLIKALHNYADGTFGWGDVGPSFYVEIYSERNQTLSPVLRSIYYESCVEEGSKLYDYQALVRQFVWFVILILVPLYAFKIEKYNMVEKVVMVSTLELMLYLQIFERHPRYLYTFVPVFIVMVIMELKYFADLCASKNSHMMMRIHKMIS